MSKLNFHSLTGILYSIAFFTMLIPSSQSAGQNSSESLKPVTVITGEWAPFVTEAEPRFGYISEVVTQTLLAMDKKANYAFYPFFAGYQKTKEGGAFATFPYFYQESRSQDFFYSDPIVKVDYVVFVRADKLKKFQSVEKLQDLKKFTIAKVSGYAYGKLDPYIKPSGPDSASEIGAFRNLLENKADYIAASREVGLNIIRQFYFKDQHKFHILKVNKNRSELSWSINIHVLFPKANPEARTDRDSFNASLKKVLTTGILQNFQKLKTADIKARRIVKLSDPGVICIGNGQRFSRVK